MEKKAKTTLTPTSSPTLSPQPWWKSPFSARGIIGRWLQPLLARLFGLFSRRETVSDNTLFLHNRAMSDVRVLGKNIEVLDDLKFGKEEFLIYVKLKYLLSKQIGEYADLDQSVTLLQLAIDAKDSFIAIDQTELRYRGSKQQDFYHYIEGQLVSFKSIEEFRQNVQVKLAELVPQIKTEEGRLALQSYSKHLDRLSEKELGLKLLSLFKAYQLADYSILRRVSELIQTLDKRDLHTHEPLTPLVMANFDAFEKLQKIINVSRDKNNPDTYARMVQVIGLFYRYGLSFMQFEELLGILKRWYRPYQTLIGIREMYPPHKYKQPPAFQEVIAGEAVYLKYKKWLTDSKTGMVYVDFDTDEITA